MYLQKYYFIPKIEGPKCPTIYDLAIIKGTIVGHQINITSPKYFAHSKPIVPLQDFLILTSKNLTLAKLMKKTFIFYILRTSVFHIFLINYIKLLKKNSIGKI